VQYKNTLWFVCWYQLSTLCTKNQDITECDFIL